MSARAQRPHDAERAGLRRRLQEKEGPQADAGKPQETRDPTASTQNATERRVMVVVPQDRILEYYSQVFQDNEDYVSNDGDTPARSFDIGPYQYPPEFPIDPESPNWLSQMMNHFQQRREHLSTLRSKLAYYVQSVLRSMALTKTEVEEESENMAELLQRIEKIAGEKVCRQLEKAVLEQGKGDPASESEVEFDMPENVKPASTYKGYNDSVAAEAEAYPDNDSTDSQADSVVGSSGKRKRNEVGGPMPGEIPSKRSRNTPKGTPQRPLRPLPRLSFDNMQGSDDEDEYKYQDTTQRTVAPTDVVKGKGRENGHDARKSEEQSGEGIGNRARRFDSAGSRVQFSIPACTPTGGSPQHGSHMQEPMMGPNNTATQGSTATYRTPGSSKEVPASEAAAPNVKKPGAIDLGIFALIAPRPARTPSPPPRHRPKRPIMYTPFPSKPKTDSQDDLGVESTEISPAASVKESTAGGCFVGTPDPEPVLTAVSPEL